jgi:hypothetical protein
VSVSAVLLARRLSWLLVAVLVFCAACSGEEPVAQPPERPAPRTSPVATSAPTPEPTAEPPALPGAAQQNTKAGAVAFAKHYIDVVNFVRLGGTTEALRRLGAATCESCAAIVQVATDTYDRGGFIHGGEWTVQGSASLPGGSRHSWQVVTDLTVAAQSYRPRAGAAVEKRRAERATLVFTLERSHDRWRVATLERQSDD